MKRFALFLFVLLPAVVLAQDAAVVPIDKEPVHKLVFENEWLRVFEVVVPPHGSTLMHRHEWDYIFATLGDSDISNERMGEKAAHVVLKDGDVRYTGGGFAHVARNLSDLPFHNITIELKNPGKPVCGMDPAPACKNSELFATEHLTVHLTSLEPGEQTPIHTHPSPHLLVALDDLTIEDHPVDQPEKLLSFRKGQVEWMSQSGTHFLKNAGKSRARLLSLESK